ncbi:oxidoreductase [Bacillus timonensis]|nr:oxidoreductase [Bacillus timonensis]
MALKVALITGASSGFGLLTALELAKQDVFVVATMRNLAKADTLKEKIKELKLEDKIRIEKLDVTNSTSIARMKAVFNAIGRIDILVNNAGFAAGGFAEEVTIEEFKQQFDTNFFGVIEVTQFVLPFMRKQKSGKIINVSSISGLIGFPGLSPYVSSKYALEGFSESLRLEVKPFGIDVALIQPGSYSTSIWTTGKKVAEKSLDTKSPYYSYMQVIEKQIESGKSQMGDPEDVAKLICKIALEQNTKKLRFPIGKGVKLSLLIKNKTPWSLWEKLVMKKLQ